jgi:hypothetical protein
MKAVKIIVAVVVVGLIGFSVSNWYREIEKNGSTLPPENLYTKEIQNKINSINTLPNNILSNETYENIQAGIDEFHKNGSLGKTSFKDGNIWKVKGNPRENDQWKEILSKNLYSAYAPKFVKQAMYVFSRSDWKINDLRFIQSELNKLKTSAYLDPNSPVAKSFNKINSILAKYNEIRNFIKTCNQYTFSDNNLEAIYPDVSDKIQKSRAYIANNLDISEVNNCIQLKAALQAIPEILFDKHINYLKKKIDKYGGSYGKFEIQYKYADAIYMKLQQQEEALNNDIYGINESAFSAGFNSVDDLLARYNREAFDHFKSKR